MYRIVVLVHADGERLPMLVNDRGFPITEPNEFALTQRGLAWRTIKKKLNAIALLYQWANQNGIDLEERIAKGNLFQEAEINGSLLAALRKSYRKGKIQRLVVGAKTFNVYVMYVREYLERRFNSVLANFPITDSRFEPIQQKQKIVLKWLEEANLSTSSATNEIEKGLSNELQNLLLALTHPDSAENPWKTQAVRQRNYLIILLLLNFGIRPAELLTLRVGDIQIGAICAIEIKRRPHDLDDPRAHSPEVKRSGRIFPILDQVLAKTIDSYIMDWRPQFDDKHAIGTDFLILSDEGNPLSYAALSKLFFHLKKAEPRFPENLSAKTLRHTFSGVMEKRMRQGGINEIRRREILAHLRGDTSEESQNDYIRQAIKEEAQSFLSLHQAEIFSVSKPLEEMPF